MNEVPLINYFGTDKLIKNIFIWFFHGFANVMLKTMFLVASN